MSLDTVEDENDLQVGRFDLYCGWDVILWADLNQRVRQNTQADDDADNKCHEESQRSVADFNVFRAILAYILSALFEETVLAARAKRAFIFGITDTKWVLFIASQACIGIQALIELFCLFMRPPETIFRRNQVATLAYSSF